MWAHIGTHASIIPVFQLKREFLRYLITALTSLLCGSPTGSFIIYFRISNLWLDQVGPSNAIFSVLFLYANKDLNKSKKPVLTCFREPPKKEIPNLFWGYISLFKLFCCPHYFPPLLRAISSLDVYVLYLSIHFSVPLAPLLWSSFEMQEHPQDMKYISVVEDHTQTSSFQLNIPARVFHGYLKFSMCNEDLMEFLLFFSLQR